MTDQPTEAKTFLGYPADLPPGQHPLDGYIKLMVALLGFNKAAAYFGIDPRTGEQVAR